MGGLCGLPDSLASTTKFLRIKLLFEYMQHIYRMQEMLACQVECLEMECQRPRNKMNLIRTNMSKTYQLLIKICGAVPKN